MSNVLAPLRCVATGVLVGLIWKWDFFRFADQVYQTIPIQDAFFPVWFRNALVLRWAYLATVASILVVLVVRGSQTGSATYWIRLVASMGSCLGSTILICHQGSYNDVTFMTAWWGAVLLVWYSWRIGIDEPAVLISKANTLCQAVISLIFLGGAVGKWTQEYWSGQVLYEIYFQERDFWFFRSLRNHLQADELRTFATYYSRLVVTVESLGALIWTLGYFFSSRTITVLVIVTVSSIGLLSNFALFSVLAPMIGLAMTGWFDHSRKHG